MTATATPAPDRLPGGPPSGRVTVSLDAASTSHCRRRIHLDHDPGAVAAPRALPDPALAQRRADAAEHRARIGAQLAAAAGAGWQVVAAGVGDPVAATEAAIAGEARLIWGAVLPSAPRGPADATHRRGGAELLVRRPGGGYVPVIVVRHRVSDPGSGALTAPLPAVDPRAAADDPARKPRSQPRDLLRLAHLHRMLEAAGGPRVPTTRSGGTAG